MYDNFKIQNYPNVLFSPEMAARHLSRLFTGDVIDGLDVVPGTGLQVVLQPGTAFIRYGSPNVASARLVSLVDSFAVPLDAADASNPRIDLIVLYVDSGVSLPSGTPSSANLDGPGVAKATFVKGIPNANPVAPTTAAIQAKVGASNSYITLKSVRVGTGVNALSPNDLSELRLFTNPRIRPSSIAPSMISAKWGQSVGGGTTQSGSFVDVSGNGGVAVTTTRPNALVRIMYFGDFTYQNATGSCYTQVTWTGASAGSTDDIRLQVSDASQRVPGAIVGVYSIATAGTTTFKPQIRSSGGAIAGADSTTLSVEVISE